MKRQQTNLKRFFYIKWGCLQQNKKHKRFLLRTSLFYIWKIQDEISIQERHPMRNNYMYNNTLHLEELQQCYYNFLQNWDCVFYTWEVLASNFSS